MHVSNSLSWWPRMGYAIGFVASCVVFWGPVGSATSPTEEDVSADAGVEAAGRAPRPDLSECVRSPGASLYELIVESSLESYCAAREDAGQTPCPKSRRDLLSLVN